MQVDIDTSGLEDIVVRQAATTRAVKSAMRSTVSRMGRWMRTRVVKALGKEYDITQRVLRRRLKRYNVQVDGDEVFVKVFAGLDPVGLSSLNPKQQLKGVRARGHFRQSAFIVNVGGRQEVFKRKGKARYPLVRQEIKISERGKELIRDVVESPRFRHQFLKEFERQLSWRMERLNK